MKDRLAYKKRFDLVDDGPRMKWLMLAWSQDETVGSR